MAEKYTVQKGDTLGDIAKRMGVKTSDITGYRSGNPDLIYAGESLNVGGDAKDAGGESYVDTLKDEMTDEYGTTEAADTTEDQPSDLYDIEGTREKKSTYEQNRQNAYENLKGLSTDIYDREYKDRDLQGKKDKISSIDSEIAAAREARDKAISDVRSNPGLSASQMTGDIAKIRDYQNDVINNKIQERNSVASEYNSELAEIDRIIGNETADAKLDFDYWDNLFGEASGTISDYTKALKEELSSEQEQSNWERQLAQALQIAEMRGGEGSQDNWKLVYDDYGNPLYWFNNATREIDYNVSGAEGEQEGGADTGGVDFDKLGEEAQTEEDTTGFWQGVKDWFASFKS